MTGSSSCNVGRLLWLVRLPNCPTSRESPGRSNPTPPATQTSLNRQPATTRSTACTQRRAQVNESLWRRRKMSCSPYVCLSPSVSLCSTTMSFPFLEDAQFEMDIWGDSATRMRVIPDIVVAFLFTGIKKWSVEMRSPVLQCCVIK